jgi:hypothetical protein
VRTAAQRGFKRCDNLLSSIMEAPRGTPVSSKEIAAVKTDDRSDEPVTTRPVGHRSPAAAPDLPLGLRITMGFVRLVAMVMILPLVGAAFGALFTVLGGAIAENPVPEALLTALVLVILTGVMLAMIGGAGWLVEHMKCRHLGLAGNRRAHPGRQVCLPTLMVIAIYGLVAVLSWIPSNLKNDFVRTYPWAVVWSCISTGAVLLARHLDRNLPK